MVPRSKSNVHVCETNFLQRIVQRLEFSAHADIPLMIVKKQALPPFPPIKDIHRPSLNNTSETKTCCPASPSQSHSVHSIQQSQYAGNTGIVCQTRLSFNLSPALSLCVSLFGLGKSKATGQGESPHKTGIMCKTKLSFMLPISFSSSPTPPQKCSCGSPAMPARPASALACRSSRARSTTAA